MLLSPPSPPTQHLFPPQPSSSQPTASPSSRSPLSVITVSSGSYTSLEDYSYSPTSESSIPHSESSTNSKTSAFFGSPFPTTSPASNSSQSLTYVSKTAAFFSAPFTDFPTPPPNQQFTPRDFPSSSRSLTADFFAGAAFSSYPTSPPSLRSSTSNGSLRTSISHTSSPLHSSTPLPLEQSEEAESTPVPKPQVPLISRLFPSRYSSNRRTSDNVPYSTRGFVDLEPPEDVLVASPPSVEPPRITEPPSVTLAAASSVDAYTTGSSVHPDNEDEPSYELVRRIGQGGFSLVWLARAVRGDGHGALVAVKMITRADEHSDTAMRRASRGERASFLREVEVLHYLTPSHASVPRLHASFTVRTHHVLVLEYVAGGELLDVVNSDEQHAQLGEKLLRRICRELVSAVEWMHTRFVVHRDIKLENILLTADPFVALPTDDQPLVKLTDFGLARKIDPDDPWLSTRCGSESYAAPELLVASHTDEQPLPALSRAPSDAHGTSSTAQPKSRASRVPGTYDGRETDAWALGVVFFALATRALPFDPPLTLDTPPADADAERARRRWVLRVVRGEWFWPNVPVPSATLVTEKVQGEGEMEAEAEAEAEGESEPCGMALAHITAMRNLVARLLVSDPRRRARVHALWDEEWLGASAPPAPS